MSIFKGYFFIIGSYYNFRQARDGSKKFICEVCNYGTNDRSNMRRHQRVHNQERPYVCAMCPKAFTRKLSLRMHMFKHQQLKCGVCDVDSLSVEEFETHMFQHMSWIVYMSYLQKLFSIIALKWYVIHTICFLKGWGSRAL